MIPYISLSLLLLFSQVKPFFTRVASQNPIHSGGVVYFNPLRQIPAAIGSYLELFVWPMDLTFYHEDFSIRFLLRLVVTVALLLSLIYFYRKQKLIFFGFAFFILSLIPTLLPIKIAFVVAERYVYFGMVGLCLVAAWALVKGLKKYPQILWVGLALWLALLSARTISRNRDWRTWESLWTATVKVSPTSSMAWNNVGFVYSQKGDYQRAIRAFQQAIKLNPTHTGAHNNLGVAFFKIGEVDQSIYWLEKSIALRPAAEVYLDLGIAYAAKGESAKAEESFRQALELDPQNTEAFNSLGVLFYHQKKIDEARQLWQQALKLDPFNEEAKKNLIILEQGLQATPSASPQP
jgi:tetratricopeptide (TPR) repeat protein